MEQLMPHEAERQYSERKSLGWPRTDEQVGGTCPFEAYNAGI